MTLPSAAKEQRRAIAFSAPGEVTESPDMRRYIQRMTARLKSILKLEVPLIVVIGTRDMPVKEVMNLAPGAILELPKLADEELEILVNNKPIGMGNAVKVGENFGIRVTYVGDLRQRIDALAGKPAPASDLIAAAPAAAAAA